MVSGSSNALQEFLQSGFQQLQQGRPQEAWNAFHQALRLDPGNAWAHHMVGLIAMQAGQLEMGIKSVQRSIAIDPNDPAAHANLANGLRDLGRLDEALAEYDRALAMAPNFLDALNNRAVLHGRAGRSKEALRDYDRAIAIDPGVAFLHNNRAATLVELGRHPEAVVAYEACLKLNPELADAGFNSGTAYLALGDYARGWERYEWRFAMRGPNRFVSDRGFAQPYWRGETSIAGKTLLLHSEQGLGDSIQFCRYADLAKAAGARVILEVEKPLTRLFASLKGADLVLEKGSALPDFDLHASLMSLPRAFRTTLATIPADIPYLHARPDEVRAWAVKLDTQTPPPQGERRRPRVGLVWSGGFRPDQPRLWDINGRRNIALRMLAPLAGAEVDYVSLQKGEAAERELKTLAAEGWNGPAVTDFASDLHDFADTAALIETLDLVVTVDTSTAHLAGALGKPVWIFSRIDGCWRWLRDRTDSPWYPTVRLFRQKSFGDWGPVIEEVAAALKAFRP
jgi:tetratricopeptide (TPR) repeat protein